MAKKTTGGGGSPTPKTTVKLSSDLHRRLRTVASYRGMELADYLDQILRPIADEAFSEMANEIQQTEGKAKK